MNQYNIYCTPSQTKKALELGAPILADTQEIKFAGLNGLPFDVDRVVIPTAEQMIGWLEEQRLLISITALNTPDIPIYNYSINRCEESWSTFSSRKEATLAAIDAALEYLENIKQ